MDEFKLPIKYTTKTNQFILSLIFLLMPFWAVILPFTIGLSLNQIFQVPIIFILFFLVLLFIFLALVFEDNKIIMTRHWLSFPLFLLPRLKFKREFAYQEILKADIVSDLPNKEQIILFFNNNLNITMDLKFFKNIQEIEQFLLTIEICAKNCERSSNLIEYQNKILITELMDNTLSYTKLWDEELNYRFCPTNFQPLTVGARLRNDQFIVLKQIAFGGFSAVYLVTNLNKQEVILKEMVIYNFLTPEQIIKVNELFKREASILAKLNHPKIAKILDFFVENERHYIVLEKIWGENLRLKIKETGCLDENLIIQIAHKLALILDYIHGLNPPVIHRDISPDNIILQNNQDVFLIDFGSANEIISSATRTMIGKKAFISPEQFKGKANKASDLYSLGSTLFYLATAQEPEALTQQELIKFKPNCSVFLNKLIKDLTNLDYNKRPLLSAVLSEIDSVINDLA